MIMCGLVQNGLLWGTTKAKILSQWAQQANNETPAFKLGGFFLESISIREAFGF